MESIGILGGTFDPIHYGHLTAAEDTLREVGLAKIIFVPASQPPHKGNYRVLDSKHRIAMVKMAISYNPRFEMSAIETERMGPSYTVDTILSFKQKYAAAELYFIMGLDSFLSLSKWKEADRLAGLCRFIVLTRPGYCQSQIEPNLRWLGENSDKFIFLTLRQVDVSSKDLRRKILNHESVAGMIPPAVEHYIRDNHLYMK